MWLTLVCVFGISATSLGEEKRELLSVDSVTFKRLREEEGSELKKQICDQRFGQVPDLAWLEAPIDPEITNSVVE